MEFLNKEKNLKLHTSLCITEVNDQESSQQETKELLNEKKKKMMKITNLHC